MVQSRMVAEEREQADADPASVSVNLSNYNARLLFKKISELSPLTVAFPIEQTEEAGSLRAECWEGLADTPGVMSIIDEVTRGSSLVFFSHFLRDLTDKISEHHRRTSMNLHQAPKPVSPTAGLLRALPDEHVLTGNRISQATCLSLPCNTIFKNVVLPFAQEPSDPALRLKFQSIFVGTGGPPSAETLEVLKAFNIVAMAKASHRKEDAKNDARKDAEGVFQAAFVGLIEAGCRAFDEFCAASSTVERVFDQTAQVKLTRSVLALDFKDLIIKELHLFSPLEQVAKSKSSLSKMSLETALSCLTGLGHFAYGVLGPRAGLNFKSHLTRLITNITTLSEGAAAYPGGFQGILTGIIIPTLEEDFCKPSQLRLAKSLSMDPTSPLPKSAADVLDLAAINISNPARLFTYQQIHSALIMLSGSGTMTIEKSAAELAQMHPAFQITVGFKAISTRSSRAKDTFNLNHSEIKNSDKMPCRNWTKNGSCRYGADCIYSHTHVNSSGKPKKPPSHDTGKGRRGNPPPQHEQPRRRRSRSRSPQPQHHRRQRSRSRSPPSRASGRNPHSGGGHGSGGGGSAAGPPGKGPRLTAREVQSKYAKYLGSSGGHTEVCVLHDLARCNLTLCRNKHEFSKLSARNKARFLQKPEIASSMQVQDRPCPDPSLIQNDIKRLL